MIELVYPLDPAPIVKGGLRGRASEMLPVVEPSGIVIAQAPRDCCHRDRHLHPVVHLHILDRLGRLYIQHRSMTRSLYPGRWDTAVGGHVCYGEYLPEALYREAAEELGFSGFNPVFIKSYVHESPDERELVAVFAAVGSFELHPDEDEVSEGRWWTPGEISEQLGKGVFTPNFEEEYVSIKDSLAALL